MCDAANAAYDGINLAQPTPGTSTDGFVQVMALIALGTVSAVIVAAMSSATVSNLSYASLERLVQSDALTASGFERLEAAVLDPNDDLEVQALQGSLPAQLELDGHHIELKIEGIGGKIDPLKTAPEIVARYLANSGIDIDDQNALAATVERARLTANPNLAWNSVLSALLGHLSAKELGKDLTQFADHSGVDPVYASPRVIAAIPDLSPSDQAAIVDSSSQRRSQLAVHSRYFAPNGTRFSLLVRVDWGQNQISERRLPVALSSAGRLIALAGPS